jgi:hypothetical protein
MSVLRWIWTALKRAWGWLLDNPVALAALAGGIVGAWFMWKRSTNKIASLEDAVAIGATKRKIAKHEARAEVLERAADAKEPEVVELKKNIAESKRRVLEINEGKRLERLTDDEVAKLFSESGL